MIIFTGLLLLPTLVLGIYHWYLASDGKTTNEHLRQNGKKNEFDRGFRKNCSIFWSRPTSRIFCQGDYNPLDYIEKEANVFLIEPKPEPEPKDDDKLNDITDLQENKEKAADIIFHDKENDEVYEEDRGSILDYIRESLMSEVYDEGSLNRSQTLQI